VEQGLTGSYARVNSDGIHRSASRLNLVVERLDTVICGELGLHRLNEAA